MINDLKRILDKDENKEEEAFKEAAYRLLARQFLYRSKGKHKRHFDLIVEYQSYFRNLMDATNHQLIVDENRGYIGILPLDFVYTMGIDQTMILFALRYVYDQEIIAFNVDNEDGAVTISMDDFETQYEQLTKRKLPSTMSELQSMIKPFTQNGIVEYGRDENTPEIHRLLIFSSITSFLDGDILKHIEVYLRAKDVKTEHEISE